MQINTREAMMRAFKLRQKYGSWEEVERRTNAVKHSLEVIFGGRIDGPVDPAHPGRE